MSRMFQAVICACATALIGMIVEAVINAATSSQALSIVDLWDEAFVVFLLLILIPIVVFLLSTRFGRTPPLVLSLFITIGWLLIFGIEFTDTPIIDNGEILWSRLESWIPLLSTQLVIGILYPVLSRRIMALPRRIQ